MAIQNRRGYLADFDPQKMLPGEWGVSIDTESKNQHVYMCFSPGVVKRMATYEDFESDMEAMSEAIRLANQASADANEALEKVNDILENGGSGGGAGEDGGYYTPEISQTEEQAAAGTMTVSYIASKDGMGDIEEQTVQLPAGKNGTSPTVSVDPIDGGHRITIVDAEGSTSFDVMDGGKGDDGVGIKSVVQTETSSEDGGNNVLTITLTNGTTATFTVKNGSKGNPGVGVKSVVQTTTSTEDSGSNIVTVTMTDGSDATFTVRNGSKGNKGDAGYAPVKGTDYWTPDDIAEINATNEAYIVAEVAKREQLEPLFANSVEECTDKSKVYVLPDGYIYGYMKYTEEVVTPGETVTTPAKAVIIRGYRYSHSGGSFQASDNAASVIFPISMTRTTSSSDTFLFTFGNMKGHTTYTGFYHGETTESFPVNQCAKVAVGDGSNYNCYGMPTGKLYAIVFAQYDGSQTFEDAYIAYDGVTIDNIEVYDDPSYRNLASFETTTTTEGSTETVETEGFANTGHAFVPADYEDRIISVETKANAVAEIAVDNTNRIEKLESKVGTVDENEAVHNAVGTTFPPLQKPASAEFDGYDIDITNVLADDLYSYIDSVVSDKKTVTKEILGKDESDTYDITRYIFAKRDYIAWQRVNYPKMYAWKNGETVICSTSVSPRIDDTLYSTKYIGTAYGTVTAVSATNRSRTVNGLEFVRYENGDVEPTVIYTDVDDEQNGDPSITRNNVRYDRYPLADLGANRKKLIPVFLYANEHGYILNHKYPGHETKMCALIVARFLRDLALDKQIENPLYKFIRENCMLITIPVVNPFGYNINITGGSGINTDSGYMNANRCNINRNYDTPGWDYMHENDVVNDNWYGHYPGSQNETQYVMNTMVESGAVVAMALHGHAGGASLGAVQGQDPDGTYFNEEGLASISNFLKSNYGYSLVDYDVYVGGTHDEIGAHNTPDVTCKSPSYITQCGAYGGIVEFSAFEADATTQVVSLSSRVVENAYAQTLNLLAMWLSDYLEQ